MTFRGQIKNGEIVLDGKVALPEGAHVRVDIVRVAKKTTKSKKTLLDRVKPFVGKAKGLPADLSDKHDEHARRRSRQ